jgi:hypothetical protein
MASRSFALVARVKLALRSGQLAIAEPGARARIR